MAEHLSPSYIPSPSYRPSESYGRSTSYRLSTSSRPLRPSTICQSQSSFMRLPTEIRLMIHKNLLQADLPIEDPGLLAARTFEQSKRMPEIHPSIIRVCKTVFEEAQPLLFSLNSLRFSSFRKATNFGGFGVFTKGRRRLALIKSLEVPMPSMEELIMNPFPGSKSDEEITYAMNSAVLTSSFTKFWQPNCLPKLRVLMLDFTHWALSEEDEVPDRVLEKFENAIGKQLHKLTVAGLESQPEFVVKLREVLMAKGFN